MLDLYRRKEYSSVDKIFDQFLHEKSKFLGLNVPRHIINEALQIMDHEGAGLKRLGRLIRRYYSEGLNWA